MSDQTGENVYEKIRIYLYSECIPWKNNGIAFYDGKGTLS